MSIDSLTLDSEGGKFSANDLETPLREFVVAVGERELIKDGTPVKGYGFIDIRNLTFHGKEGTYFTRIPDETYAELFPDYKKGEGGTSIVTFLVLYLRKSQSDHAEAYLVSKGLSAVKERPSGRIAKSLGRLLSFAKKAARMEEEYSLVLLGDQLKIKDFDKLKDEMPGEGINFKMYKGQIDPKLIALLDSYLN